MREPIIINESPTPLEPGCIDVFASARSAEHHLEAWYADESYFACDLDGLVLEILPNFETGGVSIVECAEEPARPDLAETFLRSYLDSLRYRKGRKKAELSDTWLRSVSVEEMAEVSLRYAIE